MDSSSPRIALRAVLRIWKRSAGTNSSKKVFWAVFIAFAGLVLAQVVDPATAQAILSLISAATGDREQSSYFFTR